MRSFVNNLCSIQLGKSPSIDIVYHPSDPIETVVDSIEIKSVGTEIKTCSSEKTVMAIRCVVLPPLVLTLKTSRLYFLK
jgi:hypothetical protein